MRIGTIHLAHLVRHCTITRVMNVLGHTREHVAAAQLEHWCLAFGRSSIAVVALVLGKLCEQYNVDPEQVATVVHAAASSSHGPN